MMTKGMKSTELWLSLLGVVLGGYLAVQGVAASTIVAVVAPLASYILSRGIAKNGGNDR